LHDTEGASKGRLIRVAKVQRRGGSYAASWYTSTRVLDERPREGTPP